MKLHGNARTCPNSRRLIVERVCEQGPRPPASASAPSIGGLLAGARRALLDYSTAARSFIALLDSCRQRRSRLFALPLFLDRYNFRRPHGSFNHRPPASRLTNVAGNYI